MGVQVTAKQANWLKGGLVTLGVLLAAGILFAAGFYVGRSSANPGDLLRNFPRSENRSGHGAIGAIQMIEGQKITVVIRGEKTQVVVVNSDTRLEKNFQKIGLTDLNVNDRVIVIGSPNAGGEINARIIGIVDPSIRPPRAFPTSNSAK